MTISTPHQATFSLAASSLLSRPSFLPHHLAMLLLLLPAARHSPTSRCSPTSHLASPDTRLGRAAQVVAGGLVVALAVRIQVSSSSWQLGGMKSSWDIINRPGVAGAVL